MACESIPPSDRADVPIVNHSGEEVDIDKLKNLMPPGVQPDRLVAFSDLDGTGVVYPYRHIEKYPHDTPGDLGLQLFVGDTQKPPFYRWKPKEFGDVFLPEDFKNALLKVLDSYGNLDGAGDDHGEYKWDGMARYILDSSADALTLYTALYERAKNPSLPIWSADDVTLSSAFGRIVTRADKAILHAQAIFDSHTAAKSLLMRTRTLPGVGESVSWVDARVDIDVGQLIRNRKILHGNKSYRLNVDPAKLRAMEIPDLKTARKVEKHFDCPTTLYEHSGVLQSMRMIVEGGGKAAWATTNIAPTARSATKWSEFKYLLQQSEGIDWVCAVSNRLEEKDGIYGPDLAGGGDYVYGKEKTRRIRTVLNELNKGKGEGATYVHALACGDSPSNDSSMMMNALANGGVAMVVCSTLDIGKKKFEGMVDKVIKALSSDVKTVDTGMVGEIDFSQIPGDNLEKRIEYIRRRILFAPILNS